MVNKMLFGFASIALTIASAATGYNVKFFDAVTINGAKLNATLTCPRIFGPVET